MREPGNSTTLSKLERQALEVGILDADCGCRVTNDDGRLVTRMTKLWRVIAGQRARQPLADPKLDLVREFACRTRREHRPAKQLIPALIRQGYAVDKIGSFAAFAA